MPAESKESINESKNKASKLSADKYEENFDYYPKFTDTEAFLEASRCLYCYEAPCIVACPTDIDIPTFIKKIASEILKGAVTEILSENPMDIPVREPVLLRCYVKVFV